MNKTLKIVLIIFILAFFVRGAFLFSSTVKWWDESVYLNLGYNLLKYGEYSFSHGFSDYMSSDGVYSWPHAGFRPPLLPVLISMLYFVRIDLLIPLINPFFGALTSIFIFFIGKRLFSERVGIYSAIFFSLIPLAGLYGGLVLNDSFSTFFIVLTFFAFIKGFEDENNKYKVLFGVFLGLALMARFTVLWIMPVFLVYLILRKKLRFLKDKYLWFAILAFFIILVPWFIYGYYEYGNILGSWIHGFKTSGYWGGINTWYFYFQNGWEMFSIVGAVSILALGHIVYKKDYKRPEIYLLLIWLVFFLGIAILMPHKEERFILQISPVLCLLSAFFIDKFKRLRTTLFIIMTLILVLSVCHHLYDLHRVSYTEENLCFLNANNFLSSVEENSVIVTDQSPLVYYYTKKETHFYTRPVTIESFKTIKENYPNQSLYIFFAGYDMPLENEDNRNIKNMLDQNFQLVYNCSDNFIYLYS